MNEDAVEVGVGGFGAEAEGSNLTLVVADAYVAEEAKSSQVAPTVLDYVILVDAAQDSAAIGGTNDRAAVVAVLNHAVMEMSDNAASIVGMVGGAAPRYAVDENIALLGVTVAHLAAIHDCDDAAHAAAATSQGNVEGAAVDSACVGIDHAAYASRGGEDDGTHRATVGDGAAVVEDHDTPVAAGVDVGDISRDLAILDKAAVVKADASDITAIRYCR